jgi:uncharacterized protein YcbK (DUF882 family)
MGDMTKNFSRSEFACNCGCGYESIQPKLVEKLQIARDYLDFGMKINSGCRCVSWNKHEGGKRNSAHRTGWAADINVTSSAKRHALRMALIKAGFNRFGTGKGFLHVDCDESKPSKVEWVY